MAIVKRNIELEIIDLFNILLASIVLTQHFFSHVDNIRPVAYHLFKKNKCPEIGEHLFKDHTTSISLLLYAFHPKVAVA